MDISMKVSSIKMLASAGANILQIIPVNASMKRAKAKFSPASDGTNIVKSVASKPREPFVTASINGQLRILKLLSMRIFRESIPEGSRERYSQLLGYRLMRLAKLSNVAVRD